MELVKVPREKGLLYRDTNLYGYVIMVSPWKHHCRPVPRTAMATVLPRGKLLPYAYSFTI
jgi:hypothetical protein